MPETPLAKIPYPSGVDAPAAAADMMGAFMSMDNRLVLQAKDAAERDSLYADAPTGTLVVSGSSKMIWLKNGPKPTDWMVIYEDTGWVDKGFSIGQGWEIATHLRARRVNKTVEIRGSLTRTGDDITANLSTNPGNISDTIICSVPPQFWPDTPTTVIAPFLGYVTGGTCSLTSSGNIYLRDAHSGSKIANGEWVQFSLMFFQDKEVRA